MKVVILAAGRSKRLKPIPDKNFLNFLGKPLIQHQLEQMSKAGLKDFIIIGGAHNLNAYKKLAKNLKLTVKVVEQKELDDGMAGAVLSVEKLVKKEPLLIVSANDVVDIEAYKLVVHAAKDKRFDSAIVGKKVSSYFPGGYLKTAKNGRISGIIEKPGAGKEPSKMVNIVIHYHRDSGALFEALKKIKSSRDDRYEAALDHLIKSGTRMKAVPYDGFWQAVKYPWHVLDLMEHFLEKASKMPTSRPPKNYDGKPQIAKNAVLRGDVHLASGVRVLDNAVIIGPAYIGKNTVVATNALVRGSNIGADCVIGFGTEVARSYIGDGVWTHTNYVGDSVIGNNCSFGAGTVTGNLRLDEGNIHVSVHDEKMDSGRNKFGLITGDNVRCGINTSFMPGIKVGSNCMIGAGISVTQDVPDNQFVYAKTELIMKENRAVLDPKKRAAMQKKMQ
ncbi:MAG TPA: sugar phosphate nucleotidyltransferase [Candidatus Gracilibacteria bacterium]|nr:sugar phosphate nucleotidyltransferase [Candidatus Gracilibacteria bacterium]